MEETKSLFDKPWQLAALEALRAQRRTRFIRYRDHAAGLPPGIEDQVLAWVQNRLNWLITGAAAPRIDESLAADGVRFALWVQATGSSAGQMPDSLLYVVVPTEDGGEYLHPVSVLADLGEALERIQLGYQLLAPRRDQVSEALAMLRSGEPLYLNEPEEAAAYALGATLVDVLKEFVDDVKRELLPNRPPRGGQSDGDR